MNLPSMMRLVRGLGVQIICYFGLFLSLTVSARALSPDNFGIYAGAVAIATFAGSVLTAGADRLILQIFLRTERDGPKGMVGVTPLIPFLVVNLVALLLAATLVASGAAELSLLFIALLAGATAARLVLSGYFKFIADNSANVIATFGLQPLVVGTLFGVVLLAAPGSSGPQDVYLWMGVTLAVEAVQLALLLRRALTAGFRVSRVRPSDPSDTVFRYVRDGLHVSLLVFFAQTGLLGVVFGTLLLAPADVGVYTVAFRVSQLILFPVIGSSQLIIPMASRRYAEDQLPQACNEIRHTIRFSLALLVASNIGFAVLGVFLLRTVMGIADPAAYVCTLILSAGNIGMAVFGIGDQIMVAIGRQREAFWISVVSSALLFLVLATTSFLLGYGIVGLACAAALPVTIRAIVGYIVVRRMVQVPVAAFD